MSNTSWCRPCVALKPCLAFSCQFRIAAALAGIQQCSLSDPPLHLTQCRLYHNTAGLLPLRYLPRSVPAVRQRRPGITPVYCQQRHESTDSETYSNKASRRSCYDAIVVLGGGLTPAAGIPAWGQRRLQNALLLYKQASEAVCVWLQARNDKYSAVRHCLCTSYFDQLVHCWFYRWRMSCTVPRGRHTTQAGHPVRHRTCCS